MNTAMPRFSDPGIRSRASAYPAGTAMSKVMTATHAAMTIVLTIHAP